MTAKLPPMRFTGATVLRDGEMSQRSVALMGGRITKGPLPEIDLSGYLILPGIIDLHGDAFERHIAPRPSAPFPIETGLRAADQDAASNGVTTAWLAQCWSWEGGLRGPDFAEKLVSAVSGYKKRALIDLRVQIRCETHMTHTEDRLKAMIRRHGLDYVVFNNHLPEAVEMGETAPHKLAFWAEREKRTVNEFQEILDTAAEQVHSVPRFICNLAEAFDMLGVQYGSHDDPDGQTREEYRMFGARVCEFPTSTGAAAVAKTHGDPVIMGAPNVVRGGSQAGNVSAMQLIKSGKCDVLVSDYHYPSLMNAAFALVDQGVLDLPAAWAMISSNAAEVLGLFDRGEIAYGKRADLVILNEETREVEATISAGRLSYMSGAIAPRLLGVSDQIQRIAAE